MSLKLNRNFATTSLWSNPTTLFSPPAILFVIFVLGRRCHPGDAIFYSMLAAAVVNSIAKLPPAHFTVQGLEVILCRCSSCLDCLSTRLGRACAFFCQRDCHSCLPQMSYAKDGPELPHDIAFSTCVSR